MRSIVLWPDEALRKKSEPVREFDARLSALAAEMIAILDSVEGSGLAAVQIGVPKRLFVLHMEKEEPRVFVNPTVVRTSPAKAVCEEGCLSFHSIFTKVNRPRSVHVQAWDEKGKPFRLEADGWLARAILHECEHLDGIVYIDHLTEGKRKRVLEQLGRIAGAGRVP